MRNGTQRSWARKSKCFLKFRVISNFRRSPGGFTQSRECTYILPALLPLAEIRHHSQARLSRGNLQHWPLERTTRRTRNPVAWNKGTWDHNRLQWVTGKIMEAKWIQVVNGISFKQNSYHHRLVANVKLRIASYQSRFVFWHQLLYGRHYFPVLWIRGPVH